MSHHYHSSDFIHETGSERFSSADIQHPGTFSCQHFGSYRLLDLIGQGASSEVYKAVNDSHRAAVKILLQMTRDSDLARTCFDREIAILRALDHPNIIELYDAGEQDDIPYMALEYVEGQSLRQLLRQYGKLTLDTCCILIDDCASALEYIHSKGIVHGDIKPANLMLRSLQSGHFQPILTDFSIARIQEDPATPPDTSTTGTIAYMSPEIIQPEGEMDHRADIYALGVMLYEMLTGELPFEGNPAEMLTAHLEQPSPNPQDLVPDVPDHIAFVVQKAMAKDVSERFQSAGEMIAALL